MAKTGVKLEQQIANIEANATEAQIERAKALLSTEDEIVVRLAFKLVGQRKASQKGFSKAERDAYDILVQQLGQEQADAWKAERLTSKNK